MGRLWLLACLAALFHWNSAFAASAAIPRPPELERDVRFWVRIYTEVTTHGGLLHDERNLAVVYETLRFAPNAGSRERQRIVDAARERYAAALRRIATATGPLSTEDQRIRDLWGEEGTPVRLLEAANQVRFQLGQADRFREGLVRSGAWESHIAETFANLGLPAELAVLPHVESSFNPRAYSKVGAAGMWQFMRSTGRRYMRIDDVVDERMDPFRSTEAAAQLLAQNYRILGSWPLALTAYNHGAAGMRRAKEAMGTDDIARIVRNYSSRTFGFASRNFYVSFLAALEVDRNAEKYFGPIERDREIAFQEVVMPGNASVTALERATGHDRSTLRELNPALLAPVWNGRRHVPRGYRLRLPDGGERWTTERLAQRLGTSAPGAEPEERVAEASDRYRVRPGDTLSGIARRYGISTQALARLNGMGVNGTLRAGAYLRVPAAEESGPSLISAAATTVAASTGGTQTSRSSATPAAPSAAPTAEAARVYVVRRGDTLSSIAARVGVSESQLLRINRIRNRDYIFEGQRLRLAADDAEVPAGAGFARTGATDGERGAAAAAGSGVSAARAQRESAEDAAALAAAEAAKQAAEPVSAAQAEALSPAVGPAIEPARGADPIDYSVAEDGTIRVAAAETLGHYAEWSGVAAARLRQLNKMSSGRPLLIGQKVRLDLGRVSRETFESRRREYHRVLQAGYFAQYRIVGTEVYVARRGDTLWNVTQRFARLPVWLIQQYNPDVDLSDMRPGTQIVVPKVEQVNAEG